MSRSWLARIPADLWAISLLTALWLLFFWRLFTPIIADQASLTTGDFSGQFVTFAAYQYTRLTAGEIPLWNPYNNGGLPFIADTQAAVFYPPRLLSIALTHTFGGGFSYRMLEWEMTTHVLLYTLTLYVFVRRLTLRQPGTHVAGLISALVGGYGGFLSGYPPLQLAILLAATWLPLALLGIHEASRSGFNPRWLLLTGVAFGFSWLAGHPQTSFLMTWLLLAYWGYRVYVRRWRWTLFIAGALLFGGLTFGLAAIQLLPGGEYLLRTTRAGFGFDAKGNGFPLQDIVQFIYPNVVSLFSPLYVGVAGLLLAGVAIWRRADGAWFWAGAALVALLWSFGANSLLYPLLYNTLPGAYFFRGQERAAFVVANALAILSGLAIPLLIRWSTTQSPEQTKQLRRGLWLTCLLIGGASTVMVIAWLGNRDAYQPYIGYFVLSAFVAALTALLMIQNVHGRRLASLGLIALIAFELFTVNMDADAVYDPVTSANPISLNAPPLVARASADTAALPYRVDGFRGLTANYGSLYELADIRGISPLWLNSAYALIEGDMPDPVSWELFAVRYVFTDWNELPVPSTIVERGSDFFGEINLHLLDNPRPFAWLVGEYEVVADDAAAYARLRDPAFNPRTTILLASQPAIPSQPVGNTGVGTPSYSPEDFIVSVFADAPVILSVAHVDYPGWRVTINEQPASILRAYGGLMAVVVPSGEGQLVRFTYEPLSYAIGALISLATWITIAILGSILWRRSKGR
jgi:hypothetical protein